MLYGVDSLHGNWFDHVTDYWTGLKSRVNVHFLFYEDLKKVCRIHI